MRHVTPHLVAECESCGQRFDAAPEWTDQRCAECRIREQDALEKLGPGGEDYELGAFAVAVMPQAERRRFVHAYQAWRRAGCPADIDRCKQLLHEEQAADAGSSQSSDEASAS